MKNILKVTALSFLMLGSMNAVASSSSGDVLAQGPATLELVKKTFAEGTVVGQNCSYSVHYAQDAKAVTVTIQNDGSPTLTTCTLAETDANLSAVSIGSDDPSQAPVVYGNSKYQEGSPESDAHGCRFTKDPYTLTVVNFDQDMSVCALK